MTFPSFNDQAVTAYEHGVCRELSQGYIDASGAEKVSTLGMILKNNRIINFDQFKLVFNDPDVRHVSVYNLNDRKIGYMFLKGDVLRACSAV